MPLTSASMVIVDLEGMLTYRNRRQPLLPLKEAAATAKNTRSLLGTSRVRRFTSPTFESLFAISSRTVRELFANKIF